MNKQNTDKNKIFVTYQEKGSIYRISKELLQFYF